MYRKVISLLLFVLIVIFGYLEKDLWLAWMKAGGTLAIFISIALVAVDAIFPVIPFPVLGGIIGAVFGVWQGVLLSLTGAMTGTMILFFLARYGFRDWAQHYVARYPKIKEYEAKFEQNSFTAILLSRVIPVVPAGVINIVCGLSRVNGLTFFLASLLGKIPNFVLVSFVGANFTKSKWLYAGIYGGYVLIIVLINTFIVYRKTAASSRESS